MRSLIVIMAGLLAASSYGQSIIATRTAAGGVDVDAAQRLSVMPQSLWTNCVLWQTYSRDAGSAYWDFSAGRNDATQAVVNSRPDWSTNGYGSMTFSGVDDVVIVADSASTSFGTGGTDKPFSIGAWVNSTSFPACDIMSKGSSAQREWRLIANGAQTNLLFALYTVGVANSLVVSADCRPWSDGTWHHVMATYTGSKTTNGMVIYRDGKAVEVASAGQGTYAGINDYTNPANIGGTLNLSTLKFRGMLDEPVIFNRALSADEAWLLFTNSVRGKR